MFKSLSLKKESKESKDGKDLKAQAGAKLGGRGGSFRKSRKGPRSQHWNRPALRRRRCRAALRGTRAQGET